MGAGTGTKKEAETGTVTSAGTRVKWGEKGGRELRNPPHQDTSRL